jgi:serine/threonine protein kinase
LEIFKGLVGQLFKAILRIVDIALQQKIEKLFYRVLEEEPEDIRQFVEVKSEGDESIITGVMELININEYQTYEQSSGNLLSALTEIIDVDSSSFDSERYQLIKKIGEGGMGSVYLASRVDNEVEHKVAIKIINSSFSTEANIDRFKKERQILASLDHENICRFLDAGTTKSGMLFVVMEYVEGIALNQYCANHTLSLSQKLSLFLQLCHAIDYAHKNLVIHRDIKPANILVNSQGKLKLLDFGIAKLVDEENSQMISTVTKVMTPAYASPEQLLGQNVTLQSDVYTLGTVLFEMIIGFRPFQEHEKNSHMFVLSVKHGLNKKPSELLENSDKKADNQSLKGDVDAILTKVVNSDKKHRYQTVSDLIHDIENYTQGYPVKARTPSQWYFLKLFILRNKLLVSLGSGFISLILGFSIYSYFQNEQLLRRGVELSIERDNAILQEKRAKLASDFLLNSFQTADPTRTFGEKLTIKQVIEDSYQKLKKQPMEDNVLSAELFYTMSEAFYGMGANELSFDAANEGLQILGNDDLVLKIGLLINRAKGYFVNKDYKNSIKSLNQAMDICVKNLKVDGCKIDQLLLMLAKNTYNQGNMIYAVNLTKFNIEWLNFSNSKSVYYAENMLFLAHIQNNFNKPEMAIKTIDTLKKSLSNDNTLNSYYILKNELQRAFSLRTQKKYLEAELLLDQLKGQVIEKFGIDNFLYLEVATIYALIYKSLNKYDEAIEEYNKIIEIKKNLELNYAFEHDKLGLIYYWDLKDYKAAEKQFLNAIEQDNKNQSNKTQDSGFFLKNLGFTYYELGKYKESLRYLKLSRDIFKQYAVDYSEVLISLNQWIPYIETKNIDN